MISHPFKPDPHGRDVCDQKTDEDGRVEFCGQRRSEHMDETHALKIQLATALKERDDVKRRYDAQTDQLHETQVDRDALRTALTDIVTLCMDVPATEDWRAKVAEKARKALYGEPGWKET